MVQIAFCFVIVLPASAFIYFIYFFLKVFLHQWSAFYAVFHQNVFFFIILKKVELCNFIWLFLGYFEGFVGQILSIYIRFPYNLAYPLRSQWSYKWGTYAPQLTHEWKNDFLTDLFQSFCIKKLKCTWWQGSGKHGCTVLLRQDAARRGAVNYPKLIY